MLIKALTQTLSSLAIGMVMLFGAVQIWWAIESLREVRQQETVGNQPAASGIFTLSEGLIR